MSKDFSQLIKGILIQRCTCSEKLQKYLTDKSIR